ncbi:hypothetical protein AARI_26290 [Glutamicibacter arilaitensis Re117]|uniref:Uncharacterized protein n=1 Tax=Glutamicibacter arilaitensis (strain DSM 16368 / CIP 108037 / IAM 15318 / JCM 13566 / NCIMB 14258 / Re117) TaxID=861360 RepID=A0ABP1U6R8_GLUAR|nr:hypothetical protein AARI_26290 [Glutamicibacter arilaitensis Re117]
MHKAEHLQGIHSELQIARLQISGLSPLFKG